MRESFCQTCEEVRANPYAKEILVTPYDARLLSKGFLDQPPELKVYFSILQRLDKIYSRGLGEAGHSYCAGLRPNRAIQKLASSTSGYSAGHGVTAGKSVN
jgi:hypothetical protein